LIKKISYILSILLVPLVLLIGCSANDPHRDDFYTEASYIRINSDGSGGYWREHNEDGINLSPGNSAATIVPPNLSTLGGYRLDALGEWLYFDCAIEADYDGVGDAQLLIYFEVNVDNSGGLDADEVDFQVEYWAKSLGERTNTYVTHNISTVVGKAEQHDLFVATVDYTPVVDTLVAFRVELITITSDVDNVIINYVKMRYPVFVSALERS